MEHLWHSGQVLVWLSLLVGALAQNQDYIFKGQTKDTPFSRCLVNNFERVPCGDPDIDVAGCEALNCCFDEEQCFYAREVTVQCLRDGQFRVVVSLDTTVPRLSRESVSLVDADNVAPCSPVSSSAAFVVFQFPVSACGTTMKEDGNYVVYKNKLSSSYEVGAGPLGSITRDSVHELTFLCRYVGSEVVSLVAEVNTVPPPLPVAAPGPLRVELRIANDQCEGKGCSDVEIYTNYYSEADYPVTKVLRDPVYVEVRILDRTDPNIVLTLEHCWATSTSSPLSMPQWSLLVDGCPYRDDRYLTTLVPVDKTSGLPNPTHYKRFIVKMFTFLDADSLEPLKEMVFIHCSTAVCYPSAGNTCEHRCGRQRRHAAEIAQSTEEATIVSSDAVIFEPQSASLARSSLAHHQKDVFKSWKPSTFPPGPRGLPFVGSVFSMDAKLPQIYMTKVAKDYGNVHSIRLGGDTMVCVAGYKMTKEALVNQGDCFVSRPSNELMDRIYSGYGKCLHLYISHRIHSKLFRVISATTFYQWSYSTTD